MPLEAFRDQSVIQQTINAATDENVIQLEQAINEIFKENNQTIFFLDEEPKEQKVVTIDIDLSPLPASKKAEGSKKGYMAKKKNVYSRQLARVLVSETQEIVSQSLYPGNTLSGSVFKEMVYKMENHLELENKAKRQQILLRLDAGFGSDSNINVAVRLSDKARRLAGFDTALPTQPKSLVLRNYRFSAQRLPLCTLARVQYTGQNLFGKTRQKASQIGRRVGCCAIRSR